MTPRQLAIQLVSTAIAAVDPCRAVRQHLHVDGHNLTVGRRTIRMSPRSRTLVVGAGKAALGMGRGVAAVLDDKISGGCLIAPRLPTQVDDLDRLPLFQGTHPLPGLANLTATRSLWESVGSLTQRDTVVCLISGGASALLTLPADGIDLAQLVQLNQLLLETGAPIEQINTVRKHLSQIKGGGLARRVAPAQLVTLILSDVVGDPIAAIGSGPTAADPTTFADALDVLERYRLTDRVGHSIVHHLREGAGGRRQGTLGPDDPLLDRVQHHTVANNNTAVRAAAQRARQIGWRTEVLQEPLQGEAAEAGHLLGQRLRHEPPGTCLVGGGETTVTVHGNGKGGRNQELALSAALALDNVAGVVVIALGTDGIDGPTDAAGAIVDGQTVGRARNQGLDPRAYLADNNAYPLLGATGDLLRTGPTGTNVNDLVVLLKQ